MDIDFTFLPVSDTLINQTFNTAVVYHQHQDTTGTYNPLTGTVTKTETDFNVWAGIAYRHRVEEGGVGEVYELDCYLDGNTFPHVPKTSDSLTYDGILWRVVEVIKVWSSKGVIASHVKLRSD